SVDAARCDPRHDVHGQNQVDVGDGLGESVLRGRGVGGGCRCVARLRPGLLADVQIIVDKVPNAINIPIQSLFEKEGKPVVYVKNGTRFEPREVKPLKRSENVMIIASGLKAGETIAMADPEAKPGDKKKKTEGKAGGAASALPGGKGGM
ncbi:MAG: hypothetical protein ACK5TN_18100, partial [Acidobacteriota bacterium]